MTDGFAPGAARGIANSLIGYIDTLAPAIRKEDGGAVTLIVLGDTPFTFDLGTYEEVRDLVGAIGRDEQAQAAIGVTLGAYVNSVVDELGIDVASRSGIEHVAQFADLVGDAVSAEQAEMVAARRRVVGAAARPGQCRRVRRDGGRKRDRRRPGRRLRRQPTRSRRHRQVRRRRPRHDAERRHPPPDLRRDRGGRP